MKRLIIVLVTLALLLPTLPAFAGSATSYKEVLTFAPGTPSEQKARETAEHMIELMKRDPAYAGLGRCNFGFHTALGGPEKAVKAVMTDPKKLAETLDKIEEYTIVDAVFISGVKDYTNLYRARIVGLTKGTVGRTKSQSFDLLQITVTNGVDTKIIWVWAHEDGENVVFYGDLLKIVYPVQPDPPKCPKPPKPPKPHKPHVNHPHCTCPHGYHRNPCTI